MKETRKIRAWQLLRRKGQAPIADLRGEQVVAIGKKALKRNKTLEQVWLPDSLTVVKAKAFVGCKRLRWVVLPSENAVGLSASVFEGCGRLRGLEHDEGLVSIGRRAFRSCVMLQAICIGGSLRRIGEEAFAGCRSLTALRLPSTLGTIEKNAFRGCWDLSEVCLEEGTAPLSEGIFRECISLQAIHLPPTVTAIPKNALRDCSALTEITLPKGVERVGGSAFRGCLRLEQVEMGLGVREIGRRAFSNTPSLQLVKLPHSVKRLRFGAFGLGRRAEKIVISVENEYMLRRMRYQLFFCGSAGCAEVRMDGLTLDERKRERRRTTLEKKPEHIS